MSDNENNVDSTQKKSLKSSIWKRSEYPMSDMCVEMLSYTDNYVNGGLFDSIEPAFVDRLNVVQMERKDDEGGNYTLALPTDLNETSEIIRKVRVCMKAVDLEEDHLFFKMLVSDIHKCCHFYNLNYKSILFREKDGVPQYKYCELNIDSVFSATRSYSFLKETKSSLIRRMPVPLQHLMVLYNILLVSGFVMYQRPDSIKGFPFEDADDVIVRVMDNVEFPEPKDCFFNPHTNKRKANEMFEDDDEYIGQRTVQRSKSTIDDDKEYFRHFGNPDDHAGKYTSRKTMPVLNMFDEFTPAMTRQLKPNIASIDAGPPIPFQKWKEDGSIDDTHADSVKEQYHVDITTLGVTTYGTADDPLYFRIVNCNQQGNAYKPVAKVHDCSEIRTIWYLNTGVGGKKAKATLLPIEKFDLKDYAKQILGDEQAHQAIIKKRKEFYESLRTDDSAATTLPDDVSDVVEVSSTSTGFQSVCQQMLRSLCDDPDTIMDVAAALDSAFQKYKIEQHGFISGEHVAIRQLTRKLIPQMLASK